MSNYKRISMCVCTLWLVGLCAPAVATLYEGSLSTGGGGLVGYNDWAKNVTLTWSVTDEALNTPEGFRWKYSYTLVVPKKAPSHMIIEASNGDDPFDFDNLANVTGSSKLEIQLFDSSNGNPNIPGSIYGIKFDSLIGSTTASVSFFSDRDPVWGDFYSKGGSDNAVYNAGFGLKDIDLTDLPSSGSVNYRILRPDSTPEPGLISLLSVGFVGLLARHRRRTA